MANPFFTNLLDLISGNRARASEVEANLSAVEAGFDGVYEYLTRALRGPQAGDTIAEMPSAASRANKVLVFDASGNPTMATPTDAMNAVNRSGDNMTGPLAQASGTAGLPSYTFTGSLGTGVWSPAADTLAWSIAGVERMRLSSNGRLRHTANNEQFGVQLNNGVTANGPYLGSSGADVFTLSASSGATIGDWSAANGLLVKQATGLGYGTGAGGTVTQATGRTTGVTLNKPSGQITLVSAAGTTAWQSFTVTNSVVAATDTPIVAQVSGTDLYEIHVTAVGAGSFRITYRTTGGTTTEQPVFKFEIHKGALS